jgi:hypothetical protein
VPLLFNSCKKEEEKNAPLVSGNVDYEFTIKINGDVHKIQGNTVDGYPLGSSLYLNNSCVTSIIPDFTSVMLGVSDKSEFNYVSGDIISCDLLFQNLSIGTSYANITLTPANSGGYWGDFTDSLQADPNRISATMGPSHSNIYDLPVTITDLGIAPNVTSTIFHHSTLKGSFNDTVYLRNMDPSSVNYYTFSIPILLEINFKAVRSN